VLNCHEATFLMSQRQERKLSLTERMKVRLHVTMCRGCSNFGRQLPSLGIAAKAFARAKADDDKAQPE
jgi:hypothetical protein